MTSPRNPGYEEAVEVLADAYTKHPTWNTGYDDIAFCEGCNADLDDPPLPSFRQHQADQALTALLDAKQTKTCETCGGTKRLASQTESDWANYGKDRPCPNQDCTDGRVPGTVPLALLAPEQVGWFNGMRYLPGVGDTALITDIPVYRER